MTAASAAFAEHSGHYLIGWRRPLPGFLQSLRYAQGHRLPSCRINLSVSAAIRPDFTRKGLLAAAYFFGSGSASRARLRFRASIRLMTLGGSATARGVDGEKVNARAFTTQYPSE